MSRQRTAKGHRAHGPGHDRARRGARRRPPAKADAAAHAAATPTDRRSRPAQLGRRASGSSPSLILLVLRQPPAGAADGPAPTDAVEPPVVQPARPRRGLCRARGGPADAPARPIAGGTDLMVALTGELGEPPASVVDLWALDALRGIAIDGGCAHPRRAHDVHGHPPLGGCAASTSRRWSRRPRRSARPRSRTAARSAGTSRTPRRPATRCRSCWRRMPSFVLGSDRGEREVPAARSGPATGARPSPRTSCCCASGSRSPADRRMTLPQGRYAPRAVDQQGRHGRRVAWRRARASGEAAAWRDVRVALGSVAATPIRAAATEAALEGRAPTPETADLAAETLAGELHPIDDVRSTAEYRRLVAARVLPSHPRCRRLVTRRRRAIRAGRTSRGMAPLFEDAPRFLARLEAAGPFDTIDDLFVAARADRPRDAGGRADRADRCAPAARGAARDGVGA